jgi:3'-phosphoadenosine 5'-phosphosulfate sulfotransferase (PAPS reductase)/FAD synthetase
MTRYVLSKHARVAVSVSGGSDSDTVMDLLELVKPDTCELRYVFFDTGLDYNATLRHLDALEYKYGVTIERRSPRKTLPLIAREHGVPFISKEVSEILGRLQAHGFDWRDSPENATEEKYGRCKSALDWYFCRRPLSANGKSKFHISRYKLLREFLVENRPRFAISDKCSDYIKKQTAKDFQREYGPDLVITGMRRAEGGRRAASIKTDYAPHDGKVPDDFRPIWFWSDEDKAEYKKWRDMRYSDCYELYGLKRTGCVGCPCNSKAEHELIMVEKFEPDVVKAARKVFGPSLDYRRQYNEFKVVSCI